uniref:Chromosome 11 open reading frame 82 n=1 Tax=Nothobranchius kuhntae TaxID=321403 RepID=A0A1A8J0F5_NOTKU
MSDRRVLVDCTVVSLQDSCVFYPCCKSCFSRIDAEQPETTRYRCSRCGYRCLGDQVEYRYRLSLWVARDMAIFGVTVFGNSLNAFFGIHATGLQKFVDSLEGSVVASTRSRLLATAVRDCFIGRHFIFGIKLTRAENGLWFGDPGSNGSRSGESTQLVASQMILPKAMGSTGCTVLSYYQILLQKASEDGSADPASLLLLNPSPRCNTTLQASGLSQSLNGSQHPYSSLAPTSPWQQSLGVITSSAEQEEDSKEDRTAPRPEQEGHLEKLKGTEEVTSLLLLEHSLYNNPSFPDYPNSSFGKVVGNDLSDHKSCSLTPKECSSRHHTGSFLSGSLEWEDLPFSESLSKFLHEQTKDFENLEEKRPNLNLLSEKRTSRSCLDITNLAAVSTSACQRNTEKTASRSSVLLDISNTPAAGGGSRDLAAREHERPENKRLCSHGCNQEDDKAFLSFVKEDEQLEEESYNCSADLFGNSLMDDRETHAESPRATSPLNLTPLTPLKLKQKGNSRRSLVLQELDFVPPSQSTPIVKLSAATRSPVASFTNLTSESSKNTLTRRRFSSRSKKSTPGRRLGISDDRKKLCQNWQEERLQRRAGSSESARAVNHKSRVKDETVCSHEDDGEMVAPTPVGKQPRCQEMVNGGSDLDSTWKRIVEDGVSYKTRFMDETQKSSHTSQKKTINDESGTDDEASLDGPNVVCDGENQTCDWSRDLFSDTS